MIPGGRDAFAARLRDANTWSVSRTIRQLQRRPRLAVLPPPGDSPVRTRALAAAGDIDRMAGAAGIRLELGTVDPTMVAGVFGLTAVDAKYTGKHGGIEVGPGSTVRLSIAIDTAAFTDQDLPALHALFAESEDYVTEGMSTVIAFARHGLAGLADSLTPEQVTAGELRDLLVSVPDLVVTVAAELSLPEDAARYYLQLLALPRSDGRQCQGVELVDGRPVEEGGNRTGRHRTGGVGQTRPRRARGVPAGRLDLIQQGAVTVRAVEGAAVRAGTDRTTG